LQVLGFAVGLGFLNFLFGYVLLALDRPLRLLGVASVSFAVSLAVTPVLVRAAGAAGGAVSICLVEGVATAGGLWALGSLVGSPLRMGALKGLGAALAGGIVAGLLPPEGPWRLGAALLVYGGVAFVLQPVPSALWRRGWRSVVAPVGALAGRSRP
jgi:O-antigen/teichoic acid export membrane protein